MKLGFLGMGNMAKPIAKGFIDNGLVTAADILAFAPNQEKLKKNAAELGFIPVASETDLVAQCDTVIIACKPYQIEALLAKIGDALAGKALWSVAAGWTYDSFRAILGDSVRIQCIMPNTPAMVGEGVFLFEESGSLTEDELSQMKSMFGCLGLVTTLPTKLMGIGGAVSGCGPAFVDLMMEAYADAAVKYGIPRKTAYQMIGQTVLGSAKLMLETGEHPGVLKDNVCSPAGTTIRGVAALEEAGFRAACIGSIDAIMNKK